MTGSAARCSDAVRHYDSVQMELNNRKHEVKAEAKMRSIAIEVGSSPVCLSYLIFGIQELMHKATVKISDLRCDTCLLLILIPPLILSRNPSLPRRSLQD